MASKSIVLKGTTYNGVESIELPQSGGGDVLFTEVSDTTATASDVASGKYFYTSAGVKTEGTASGGGGSSWTLLTSEEFTVSTTSTSNITVGTIAAGASAYTSNKILVISIRDKAGQRIDHFYGSDSYFVNPYPIDGGTSSISARGLTTYYVLDGGHMGFGTTTYGIYGYSVNSQGNITIYARYSSSSSHTIDGTFKCDVYLLDWPDGVTPFVPVLEE